MTNHPRRSRKSFGRPLPYGVSVLRFDAAEGGVEVSMDQVGGWPAFSRVLPLATARRIADAADREMAEMDRDAAECGYPNDGWTDGGFSDLLDGDPEYIAACERAAKKYA